MFGLLLELGLCFTDKTAEVEFIDDKEKDMIVVHKYCLRIDFQYRKKKLYLLSLTRKGNLLINSYSYLYIEEIIPEYDLIKIKFLGTERYALIEKDFKTQILWVLQDANFRKAIAKCENYYINLNIENYINVFPDFSKEILKEYLMSENYLVQYKDWFHRYDVISDIHMKNNVLGKGSEDYVDNRAYRIDDLCDMLYDNIVNGKARLFRR